MINSNYCPRQIAHVLLEAYAGRAGHVVFTGETATETWYISRLSDVTDEEMALLHKRPLTDDEASTVIARVYAARYEVYRTYFNRKAMLGGPEWLHSPSPVRVMRGQDVKQLLWDAWPVDSREQVLVASD
jgi:hypothetical protein